MPFIGFGKDFVKHCLILVVLAFFGVITINHFWHKPIEKDVVHAVAVPQVERVLAPVPGVEKEVIAQRAMTVVERARYIGQVEHVEDACLPGFNKAFKIDFRMYTHDDCDDVSFGEKEIVYHFIGACYNNPGVAKEIAEELRDVRMYFSINVDSAKVESNAILFPFVKSWADPKNVLAYLKSPYKK